MEACLETRQLNLLLADQLTATELATAESHLNGCRACQTRLAGLAGGQDWSLVGKLATVKEELSPRFQTVKANLFESRILVDLVVRHNVASSPTPGLKGKLERSTFPGSVGRFGEYEIHGLIGQGGVGAVYKATHPNHAVPIALKVLQPHAAHNKQARARFMREAQVLLKICQENVVRVIAVEEIVRTPCIVMERVVGGTLEQWVHHHGPLDAKFALLLAVDAACGLQASHRLNILHRDIKPANLLIEDQSQRLKITDFGLAKVMHEVGLTASNKVPGTPAYMSPEQISGNQVDARSDLFTLGTTLYFAVTGTNPFADNNILQVFRNVAERRPPPILESAPNFPPHLAHCITSLLEKEPAARPRSAGEFLRHLHEAMS